MLVGPCHEEWEGMRTQRKGGPGPLAQIRVPAGPTVSPPSCLGLFTPPTNILKHRKIRTSKVTLRVRGGD